MFLLILLLLLPIALAQGISWQDFLNWGSDPLAFIGGVAVIVHIIRQGKVAEIIDGRWLVGAFTVVVGAVVGVIVAAFGGIHISPFDTISPNFMGQGLSYGAVIGLSSFLGINLIDLVFSRNAKASAKETAKALAAINATNAGAPSGATNATVPSGSAQPMPQQPSMTSNSATVDPNIPPPESTE